MAGRPHLAVLVTAAGRSERFGGGKKELLDIAGRSVLDRALSPFIHLPSLECLVVTAPRGGTGELRSSLSASTLAILGPRLSIVEGGASRRDSVRLGLEEIADRLGRGEDLSGCIVLVHDGARPWASEELAKRVLEAAREKGAAIPVLPLVDTPKELSPGGFIEGHPERSRLGGAQTPQGFGLLALLAAHQSALAEGFECTDDAELHARYAGPVAWVEGERENRKITFREDLDATDAGNGGGDGLSEEAAPPFRVGEGWDLHRLTKGRRLMLGGVEIPSEVGELAHSDGDVLLHAIIDALLGGAALGDIGEHFPPSDERWRDADSRVLAAKALELVGASGWVPVNLDCTVVLERPKLLSHRGEIRRAIAATLGMAVDAVSVKAKTSEGVDAAGEGRAIEARAIVLLARMGYRYIR